MVKGPVWVSGLLAAQLRYVLLELFADLGRRFLELGVVDRLHGGNWVDCRHLDSSIGKLLHDHIARQHGADLVFQLERFIGELWIARAKYAVLAKRYADLLAQSPLHVDLRDDAKAFGLESGDSPRNGIVKR